MRALGIAGVGLIGGSIARRAAAAGWDVGVFDVDAGHARYARERLGASIAVDSLAELADRSDVVVLAAPLGATLAHLGELARARPARVELAIDVASVKAPVTRAGAAIDVFVGTHPIAGSERGGPEAADGSLFEGRVWSYDDSAPAGPRARTIRFIEEMGARPVAIASDEHDRVVALTSHLPQVLSTALASALEPRLAADAVVGAFCGTGMRSTIRLAGSSWTVWEAVLRANARPLAQEVRRLADILCEAADALEHDAPGPLAELFARAALASARLDANDRTASSVVPVNSPDER